jgi:diguanylate cyclase (GGDEF)-like protein/PAS domain S-box-containing protein
MRRVLLTLVAGALALAPYWFLHGNETAMDLWALAVCGGAIAALLTGVSLHRPTDRRPWYLVAAALGCFAAAAAVSLALTQWLTMPPFPSPVTWLQFAAYPILVAALAVFVRRRTAARDWAAIIDAGIVTLGPACALWLLLVEPAAHDPSLTLSSKLVIAGFVVAGLALLGATVRLLLTAGLREPSHVLIGLAVAFQLIGGSAAMFGILQGRALDGVVLLLLAGQILWAAAALHPRMPELTQPGDRPDPWLTRRRLALLVPAVLVTLLSISLQTVTGREPSEIATLVAIALLLGLIAARLAGVVAAYERFVQQEAVLQSCAAVLAVAQTHEEIRNAAARAGLDLAGGAQKAYVDVDLTSHPRLEVKDAAVVGSGEIAASLRGEIRRAGALARAGAARTLVVPIVLHGRLHGALRVTGVRPLGWHLQQGLATLTSRVELALEGLELTDDLLERKSEARFRSLVQNSNDLIAVLEPDLTIRYVTPSARALLGCEPSELVGTRLDEKLHPDEIEETVARFRDDGQGDAADGHEFRLLHSDGRWLTFEGVMRDLLEDPSVGGLVLTARDVTGRRLLEDQLTHQAFHDALTGLPNRALLSDRVTHALARATRSGSDVAVLFLDVDDFKTINDSLGHEAGDEVLVELAARIQSCMRGGDTAARLGGDEFAIVLEETKGVDGAVAFAERALEVVARPVMIGGAEILPRASIGITFGRAGESTGELLRNADVAMYQAKRTGGSRYELYDPQMHDAARKRLELKADLERAFKADELELHYQPIVDLDTGGTIGLETLLRWTHPVHGRISPGEFVPLAEETGLIGEIGQWVLTRACRQVREWQATVPGYRHLSANVNVSARQIFQPGLRDRVVTALEESGLRPEQLVLEITESILMEDVESVARVLAELRAVGVRISIDDFGTGFSSLSYLQRFPVDELKVAKEFVDDVVRDSRKASLVAGILQLAGSLELRTIAEGIEQPEQRHRLHELGCMLGQGYLFARPTAAALVPELLCGVAVTAA